MTSSGNVLSGVTMGFLLRLVTGSPTGGRGPPAVLEFLVINFSVCLVVLLSNCSIIIYCIVWFQLQPLMVVFHTIRYDMRCYFNVRSKANMSQLNIPHGTDN